MATATRSARKTLACGPFKGVLNTTDPYDDDPEFLVDAANGYIPDPAHGSGFYARPGFGLQNTNSPLTGAGQGVYCHVALDGTVYNFLVAGGHLYRADAALTTFTDVTPTSVVVIDATVRRVYFTSFGDFLVINDGVHRPWLASALSSAHVTGAYIDFDGLGTAWTAVGRPVIYAGSMFLVLGTVNGVGVQTDTTWTAPGAPATGYQQPGYDFRWTLEQTGSSPIYALWGTNAGLYYWRAGSISTIAGVPGPNLQQANTSDSISVNVGTLQSATIGQYGNTIFFCDQVGRPWMLPLGSAPVPIWLSMRAVIDGSTANYPQATAQVACAVIEPTLNLYLAAIYSPVPGVANAPQELQVFDAKTGTYVGRWTVGPGIAIEAMGVLNATSGLGSVVIIGSKVTGGNPAGGYVWTLNTVVGGGIPLTTEDGLFLLTEEGLQLTTENTVPSWLDNGEVPDISATTQRLGYSADKVWNVDQATVITTTAAPCRVTMRSPTTSSTVQGTPTPSASADGTYRLVTGADVQGRGVQVTVSPTTADAQWSVQSVGIVAVASAAGSEDA